METTKPSEGFQIIYLPSFRKALERIAKRDAVLHQRIEQQVLKLARWPFFGKPLRYSLKNQRRLHVGSFIIIYEIVGREVHITDFNHHDDAYKK